MGQTVNDDPFGTARLRETVLAGWAASAARFREDANSELDYALGGYRDRVVVELAQNAADAARRADVAGRLLLQRVDTAGGALLLAANTGAPLDPDGVLALATLRASTKRDDESVGRFGVGFAAVLAVADEVVIASHTGAVRFSRQESHQAVVALSGSSTPELAVELERREGHVPTLRLPFPTTGQVPEGYDTAVILQLRDAAAAAKVDELLDHVDDTLLLALPALDRIDVERPGRARHTVTAVEDRWHVVRHNHRLTEDDLADRPVEERSRRSVGITWAAPKEQTVPLPGVFLAPTPTDEPMTLPAVLIATLPLEPSRRRVAPGRAADAVLDLAARAYVELVDRVSGADRDRLWALVPTGLGAGPVDAALREQIGQAMQRHLRLPLADGSGDISVPDAVVLADLDETAGAFPVATALSRWVAGLVVVPRRYRAVTEVLQLSRHALADLIHQLPTGGDPAQWQSLYAALAATTDRDRVVEALATVPVPLADGRVVRGPRHAVLLNADDSAEIGPALARLGVRVVAPAAAHPVLERAGAQSISAATAIDLPDVQEWVRQHRDDHGVGEDALWEGTSFDGDIGMDGATAVLTLLAASESSTERGWLGDLLLRDEDDEFGPARELVLPGSAAADVITAQDLPRVHPDLVRTWGAEVLTRAGVVAELRAVLIPSTSLGDLLDESDSASRVDWLSDWAREEVAPRCGYAPGAEIAEFAVVADLDVISDQAWPTVLRSLAHDPATRRAVITPISLQAFDTDPALAQSVISPTAWWVRRELFPEAGWAASGADPLIAAVLPPAPVLADGLDAQFATALGAVRRVADLDPAQLGELLDAASGRVSDVATLVAVWRDVATMAHAPLLGDPPVPHQVPAYDPNSNAVVAAPAESVTVVEAPFWLQRTDLGPLIPVPPGAALAVADLVDLAVPGDVADVVTEPAASERIEVSAAVTALVPQVPQWWRCPDELRVDGQEVDWWVRGSGPDAQVWALTLQGAAQGLAWAGGQWSARVAVLALLTGQDDDAAVVAEAFG